MKKITTQDVIDALNSKNGVAKITYKKKDGTIREMFSSTRKKEIKRASGHSKTLIHAVDAELGQWRSFYVEDVISLRKNVRLNYGAKLGLEFGTNTIVSFKKRSKANELRRLRKEAQDIVVKVALLIENEAILDA